MTATASDYTKSPFFTALGQTLKGVAKILVQSRHARFSPIADKRTLIIMGNGPSLSETIDGFRDALLSHDTMAVNFAANTPEFSQLKPKHYILADPHFFRNSADVNVSRLLASLQSVTWPMTLYIPFTLKKLCPLKSSGNLSVEYYNAVGVSGFRWFRYIAYRSRRAMPRPRNVLIPAIMVGIWLGYDKIYITGADHSWTRTLSVDDDNNVVSVQPHFYREDKRELERIRKEYHRHPLHSVLESMSIAFRSYFIINDFASRRKVDIYNSSPGSFIDAFPRKKLPQ